MANVSAHGSLTPHSKSERRLNKAEGMTAYLLVTINVRDLSWVEDYSANVPALVHRHGGEYLAVSETIKRQEGGGADPDSIVLFTFPSMEAIEAFLSDPDYAPYREARLAATSGDMFAFTPRG